MLMRALSQANDRSFRPNPRVFSISSAAALLDSGQCVIENGQGGFSPTADSHDAILAALHDAPPASRRDAARAGLPPPGAEGRTPSNYEADVHLGYPVKVGKLTANIILDFFNILNAQRPVLLDERWGFQEADNASPTPVNPNYGKAVLRTPPTSARLGFRLTF